MLFPEKKAEEVAKESKNKKNSKKDKKNKETQTPIEKVSDVAVEAEAKSLETDETQKTYNSSQKIGQKIGFGSFGSTHLGDFENLENDILNEINKKISTNSEVEINIKDFLYDEKSDLLTISFLFRKKLNIRS